jgi:Arc/MetJ-type ribon-helix-helix transcriptional regulator
MVFGTVDLEKITVNMGVVDLGKIDLLVEEGFYGNRTDFIRTAIRNQLDRQGTETAQAITRKSWALGTLSFGRKDLEKMLAAGERRKISVVGLLSISDDVSPELADQTIESVTVRGVFRASPGVKDVLASRTH